MSLPAQKIESQARKLRVGLFADSRLQPRWIAEAFARVAASDFAEVASIAVEEVARPRRSFFSKIDHYLFARGSNLEDPVDLAAHVPHGASGHDLDVAFALGEFDDTCLDGIARYGVWRFHVDGVREAVEGEPLTPSSLRARLAPGAEARLVAQSWSRTYPLSVARNRAQVLAKTSEFAWRALREAHRSGHGWLEQCRAVAEGKRGQDPFSAKRVLTPFPPIFGRMFSRGIEKALHFDQWFLAFRRNHNGAAIPPDLAGFTRIVPPQDRYWADPFVIEKGGRHYVFFEEIPFSTNKGHISVLEIAPDGSWSPPVKVLERDFHLSYPFLLEHEGRLYMIPESAQNRAVEAYRCVEFPHKWRPERKLLDGVRLVDATLFKGNNGSGADRWWMFANGAPGGSKVFDDELHLFHADGPFGDWQPHERNPVRSDVRGARPAGALFWRNGALHRPAQICTPRYGAGLAIHRVLRLTPRDYAERQVERVLPLEGSPFPLYGMHTVNRAGDLTVVDALARKSRFA